VAGAGNLGRAAPIAGHNGQGWAIAFWPHLWADWLDHQRLTLVLQPEALQPDRAVTNFGSPTVRPIAKRPLCSKSLPDRLQGDRRWILTDSSRF